MTSLVLTGPSNALCNSLRDYCRKHDCKVPAKDQAYFEVSSDVYEAYFEIIAERMGGRAEYRRWRKKQPPTERGLRYASIPIRLVEHLPPNTINLYRRG